jgi:muramoyltetrapeptide carboxypeptidase
MRGTRMIKPRALKAGDRIALVSPASPFSREEFDKGVAELRRLGFEPVYDDSVFERTGYVSGSPQLRAAAWLRAWSDPDVAALVAVRGGYGSVHLLPYLDAYRGRLAAKLFIGYSDNTSLLSWLTCQCGMTALHSPMLEGRLARGIDGYDERSFMRLVSGEGAGLELRPSELVALRGGDAGGPLYGGTLTQLAASMGTPYAFDPPQGCVLFLEDVNERPYRLDRLLTQLRLSGILDRAVAMVFGEMRGCEEAGGQPALRDVLTQLTEGFAGPVLLGFPSGHTIGPSWSLPLGVRVRATTDPHPAIVVEESPVE